MRRTKISVVVLLVIAPGILTHATDAAGGKPDSPAYALSLGPGAEVSKAETKPFPIVLAWIAQNAPGCPPEVAPEVAAKFIEQLSLRHPGEPERLEAGEVPLDRHESLLWQVLAMRLTGAAYESQRQTFAIRRVRAVAGRQGDADLRRAETAVSRLKEASSAAYRRLAEGRMEDEDVLLLPGLQVEKPVAPAAAASIKSKVLTAQEIVSELSRRNQKPSELAKLRAYMIEADTWTPTGENRHMLLYKLRPDRFRLVLQSGGTSLSVTAFDGTLYWRQLPGKPPEIISGAEVAVLRHIGDLVDPMREDEGYSFERLEDSVSDGKKNYRVRIKAPGAVNYIAVIDQENFLEVGRENPDGSTVRYTDFRNFAGVMVAYKESTEFADGHKNTLVIEKITANPGLIEAFFTPPSPRGLDFFALERLLAQNQNPPAPAKKP